MKREKAEAALLRRIRAGEIRQQDVVRRLAEIAFGRANDCVQLVLAENPDLEKLDLSLLSEVKRNEKGTVEIRLIDRLKALEQLALAAKGDSTEVETFLKSLQGETG
ncbi:MAG: terminase small subunit [Oscillospiraceae bacterium]|nr:terminase small subunit [Oscillospiraceae bacterium]